jgi:tRNA1Val (adenine37-N6)-methyltransferase
MTFQFKQFSVEDERSSMRVGTDSVLLGSWIKAGNFSKILDIGTGCGVIALMMAQKCNAIITALDIDEDSVSQASDNFQKSPWKSRMKALHSTFQDFSHSNHDKFDLIISNPPYFTGSLKPHLKSRSIARHNDQLNPHDLLKGVTRILSPTGKFFLILPAEVAISFQELAKEYNLYLFSQLQVKSKPGTKPKRIAMEFSFSVPVVVISEEIIIRNEDNSFTEACRGLTKDFYLDM